MGLPKGKMEELQTLFGGMCVNCGSKQELQFAHILPTRLCGRNSRGSSERYYDILKHPLAYVLLCRLCHNKRGPSPDSIKKIKGFTGMICT